MKSTVHRITPDIYYSQASGGVLYKLAMAEVARNTNPIQPPQLAIGDMAQWGMTNGFPQEVIQDIRRNPEIGPLLDKQARLLVSGGLKYGRMVDGQLQPFDDKQAAPIRQWLRKTNINRYLLEAAKDLYTFYNSWIEIVLTLDQSKIANIVVQPAEWCRLKKQNNRGISDTLYINANFPTARADDKATVQLPIIDPYYDAATWLKENKGNKTNFIYPLSFPSPGSAYYQVPEWNSIRTSGWLDVSAALPLIKKALMSSQVSIKYHVEISDQYWSLKWPDFSTKTAAEQAKIKQEEIDNFQKIMSSADAQGGNFISGFITDLDNGKDFSLWKITPIDDKIKSGTYLEEGKEASLYTMSAVGLHPALVGTMPNNGLGGAGSNIREAYNLHMIMTQPHQEVVLEPLYMVSEYNGWPEDIVWQLVTNEMNTLDKGSDLTQKK